MAAFCRERQLRASHFYWWKKQLGASGAERFVEVKLATAAPTLGADEDRRVEVVLRNGRSLRVGRGFDPELVRALAAVLESAAREGCRACGRWTKRRGAGAGAPLAGTGADGHALWV